MQTEPATWRRFQKGLGGQETLKPDLYLALGVGDYEDRWFVEIDRATESSTAVLKKCQIYQDYRRSGVEERLHDVFPRVLWLVPHERRTAQLRSAFQKRKLPTDLFDIATFEQAVDVLTSGSET
jgi:hypothetical protein